MTTTAPMRPEATSDATFRKGHLLLHVALILGSLGMLLPFGWMLATSLKSPPQIFTYPPSLVPNPVVWRNYLDTVQAMPFGRFYLNSLFVAVCVTTLQILTSSLAAFAFGRLRFRGREALFLVYLATLMIPFPRDDDPQFHPHRLPALVRHFLCSYRPHRLFRLRRLSAPSIFPRYPRRAGWRPHAWTAPPLCVSGRRSSCP